MCPTLELGLALEFSAFERPSLPVWDLPPSHQASVDALWGRVKPSTSFYFLVAKSCGYSTFSYSEVAVPIGAFTKLQQGRAS